MVDAFPDLGDWNDTRRSLHAGCRVLSAARGELEGSRGAVQPWAHHFDLACEPVGEPNARLPCSAAVDDAAVVAELLRAVDASGRSVSTP